MLSFLQNLFSASHRKQENQKQYAEEKETALKGDVKKRLTLASSSKTHQEILYYLAEKDPDPLVRKAVAENKSTPVHASAVLARDPDIDVRMSIAARLIKLLPSLSKDKQSQLYAYAVQALGTLALDEVLKIRKALSSALKDHADTPPKIAGQLARDLEQEVSAPILKFCAALSDKDLLEILSAHPATWAIEAIAGRERVSADVSRAVIATDHIPAGEILLENKGAEITDSLLEEIIHKARDFPEWQTPLACRKNLPPAMVKELASYAESAVQELLLKRSDFDEDTLREIADVFKRRLAYAEDMQRSDETAVQRVARMYHKNELNENVIFDALAMRDRAFVMAALAQMTKYPLPDISRIFDMRAPKPIVSLTWKAGLSMRAALRFQKELGKIPHHDLIYPKGGDDFPLSVKDMNWQLEFLGLKV
jgi:uncharacterized protein (DUF2336 family)